MWCSDQLFLQENLYLFSFSSCSIVISMSTRQVSSVTIYFKLTFSLPLPLLKFFTHNYFLLSLLFQFYFFLTFHLLAWLFSHYEIHYYLHYLHYLFWSILVAVYSNMIIFFADCCSHLSLLNHLTVLLWILLFCYNN